MDKVSFEPGVAEREVVMDNESGNVNDQLV